MLFCKVVKLRAMIENHTSRIILLFLILLFLLLVLDNSSAAVAHDSHGREIMEEETETGEHEYGHVSYPPHTVLFPCFILTLGVVVYYVLSRYLHFLPYTAIMFILGTIMGVLSSSELAHTKEDAYMYDTIKAWSNINSEVLLLVFLPGLIFKDALGQNPHLFAIGFLQLFIFAFPLVLAGTGLTALIGYFIFPYDWTLPLCLTFGSILSATDPVAVAALLDEVGAPPRMKTHIAGESLLNDGAAIVFFYIFQQMFLYEFNIEGVGENIDFGEGVKIFCQKAIGGVAIGLAAGGLIILLLSLLNHRFGTEENIVQVTAVLGMAYLNYFVADLVCATSGVIATVFAGLVVKFFGRGSINNTRLMDDFFCILEHILNTVLFTLGGLVWGNVIIINRRNSVWSGSDWGYLILLYLLLHVIRGFLFSATYPITVRIGLSTNWAETIFQIYGGLRGAVGIALAIALDNETEEVHINNDVDISTEMNAVKQLYQMVGGIALMTLVINGTSAGPILIKLGLADSSEARHRIIEAYRIHLRAKMIDEFVKLLVSERYKQVDFGFVQKHIPFVSDLTLEQLAEAVAALKDTTPTAKYIPPYLDGVLKHLKVEDGITSGEEYEILKEDPEKYRRKNRMERRKATRGSTCRSSMASMMQGNPLSTKELRLLFISMVRVQYENQISEGFLTSEHGLTIALQQSLEEAETEADNGGPLNDLHYLRKYHEFHLKMKVIFAKATCGLFEKSRSKTDVVDFKGLILEQFAFVRAQEEAQRFFQEQLGDADQDLSEAGKIVISESKKQVKESLRDLNRSEIEKFVIIVSTHKFCEILLNKAIKYVENLNDHGLLKDSETEEMVEEIVHNLLEVKVAKVEIDSRRYDSAEREGVTVIEGNCCRNGTDNKMDKLEESPVLVEEA